MEQHDLQITTNVVNGKEYKNINLKPGMDKTTCLPKPSLLPNTYVDIIKHKYSEGLEKESSSNGKTWKYYICIVEYKGEEVSFFLNEKEHDNYKLAGDVNDTTRISLEQKKMPDGKIINFLNFAKV